MVQPVQVDFFEHMRPHETQRVLVESDAKEIYCPASRRWGKTRGAQCRMRKAMEIVYRRPMAQIEKYELVPRGFHAWVVVPANPQGRQVWNELKLLLPQELIRNINEDDKTITLNGPEEGLEGLIEMKSAYEPESLQGAGLDYLWINESQISRNAVWTSVRPMLNSPGRLGWGFYEGIPPTWSGHWFWGGCKAAEAGRLESTEFYTFTYLDNPFNTEKDIAEIEALQETMTRADWRRTYLAEFNEDAGFFRNYMNCRATDREMGPLPGHRYVAGLDLGSSHDLSVLTILDAAERRLVHHVEFDGGMWPDVKLEIADLAKLWNLEGICPDASGLGKSMVQDMVRMGLPILPFESEEDAGVALTPQRRQFYLSQLAVAFERATIQIYDIPKLIEQLGSFVRTRTPSGMDTVASEGEHDDYVFSLALGVSICDDPVDDAILWAHTLATRNERRYRMPTQAEVNGGTGRPKSIGRRLIKRRRSEEMAERFERAGIDIS